MTLSSVSPNLSKHGRFSAFWLSLCFGSFLVCHDTAFSFSRRAMTYITFLTHFVKKTSHLLLGLSCKVFTFDHLFSHRSDFFNNLTISLTKCTEYRKNRCLSSSTNSVRLHFRERVEKTKENAKKKTKIENLQNRREKYGGKKIKKYHNFHKF